MHNIETTAQAAEALRPIAGQFAFLLFAMGIIGTGLLAAPVLAGSVGYAIGEAVKWPTGLDRKSYEAKKFYLLVTLSTALGAALNFVGMDPFKALLWAALINCLVSVPILVVLMRMARNIKIMGKFIIPLKLLVAGWLATFLMMAAAVLLIASMMF
jgi:Mn2+/Fe2+ NRAMP family transporter